MSKFNISNVDIKLLSIFCAVFEEGSISKGAKRLNLSQPVVSHSLERLRLAFNDPLFVRAGRSIAPTDRANFLAPEISEIVDKLIGLAEPETLNLEKMDTRFRLSANDFERQLIAPGVLNRMLIEAPNTSLRLTPANETYIDDLRARDCDLVISPLAPPDQLDIFISPLFEDASMCFFDPSQVSAEEVLSNYEELGHAVVRFGAAKTQIADRVLQDLGITRKVKLESPSFESLSTLMRGTRLITTLPSKLRHSTFSDFDCVPLPFEFPTVKFNMLWHKATHQSPAHQWFRTVVQSESS